MQVYLVVEVHEDGRVEPSVGVMSTPHAAYMASGMPKQPSLETVDLGIKVATEVLDFAERIKREAREVAF